MSIEINRPSQIYGEYHITKTSRETGEVSTQVIKNRIQRGIFQYAANERLPVHVNQIWLYDKYVDENYDYSRGIPYDQMPPRIGMSSILPRVNKDRDNKHYIEFNYEFKITTYTGIIKAVVLSNTSYPLIFSIRNIVDSQNQLTELDTRRDIVVINYILRIYVDINFTPYKVGNLTISPPTPIKRWFNTTDRDYDVLTQKDRMYLFIPPKENARNYTSYGYIQINSVYGRIGVTPVNLENETTLDVKGIGSSYAITLEGSNLYIYATYSFSSDNRIPDDPITGLSVTGIPFPLEVILPKPVTITEGVIYKFTINILLYDNIPPKGNDFYTNPTSDPEAINPFTGKKYDLTL